MRESEQFEQWFKGFFMCSREPSSLLIISDNKTIEGRFVRILEVCKMILDNPQKDIKTLRKEVALKFFITMRGSLDYLNYAQLIISKWEEFKIQTEK
jgi:hypothetical protein